MNKAVILLCVIIFTPLMKKKKGSFMGWSMS